MISMDWFTLVIFCFILIACLTFDISILWALVAGLMLFLIYGRMRGHIWKSMLRMSMQSVWQVHDILLTFLLIGVLTSMWRASGTIPVLICHAAEVITPACFTLSVFLINCAVSVLTGSAFATSATIGVICASMAPAMGANIALIGGAVLAGSYFGDRWSPFSTSAMLTAAVSDTNVYDNIGRMVHTTVVPLVVSCILYALSAFLPSEGCSALELSELFGSAFDLKLLCLAPAIVIIIFAALRISVQKSMLASIATAIFLALLLQGMNLHDLLEAALLGYHAQLPEIGILLDGGGVKSMLRVTGIVCLSASYGGLLSEVGLLEGPKRWILHFSEKSNRFAVMCVASLPIGMMTCSQALSIMITAHICKDAYCNNTGGEEHKAAFALDLEDTAVVTSTLIPWSVACCVPLSAIGAPNQSILFAFFLYLLPLCRLVCSFMSKK